MTICKDATCTAFTDDELVYAEALDVSLDGSSDGLTGQVIGCNAAPGTLTPLEWEAYYAAALAAAAWTTATSALVYYFDGKP